MKHTRKKAWFSLITTGFHFQLLQLKLAWLTDQNSELVLVETISQIIIIINQATELICTYFDNLQYLLVSASKM